MLTPKMQQALNDQVKWELYSAYLYLSMSAYFSSINLMGFANWMRVQAQEELAHAVKFYDFLIERQGKVILQAVEAPPFKWASPLAAFQKTYEHEQSVTARINDLADLALKTRDHATHIFVQWFVTEQVEEEAAADAIVQQLKLIGKESGALFMLDRELRQRVFTPPAAGPAA